MMATIKKLIKFLLVVYFLGFAIAYLRFNNEYSGNHSVRALFIPYELMVSIKAGAWPYCVLAAMLNDEVSFGQENLSDVPTPPPDGQVIASFKETAWWLSEYKRLNVLLDDRGGSLNFSYTTGPNNSAVAKIWLFRAVNGSLIMKLDMPQEAFLTQTESGNYKEADDRVVLEMRDHDLDGWVDDVLMGPNMTPIHNENFTEDGFMLVRDSVDHSAIILMWTVAVAVTTNHFLHGKDSVFSPRSNH